MNGTSNPNCSKPFALLLQGTTMCYITFSNKYVTQNASGNVKGKNQIHPTTLFMALLNFGYECVVWHNPNNINTKQFISELFARVYAQHRQVDCKRF